MFCVSFLSNLLSALCAYFGLVLSHALGYVAAPLAKPEREHLADQLVRERDEVVQRGVRRADLAAIRETAEGQDLQSLRQDVRAPGTVRAEPVDVAFDRGEVGVDGHFRIEKTRLWIQILHQGNNRVVMGRSSTSAEEHGYNFHKHPSAAASS